MGKAVKRKKRVLNLTLESSFGFDALDIATLKQMVAAILDRENFFQDCLLTIIFIDDVYMIDLHRRYLQTDENTDVMAFDLSESADRLEGEVYINVMQAKRQALEFKANHRDELLRLVAHGTLHLLGYDDQNEAQQKIMSALENQAIDDAYLQRPKQTDKLG